MKNPANPGDFGTNGTRGVVLSGMTKTVALTVCALACWVGVLVCSAVGLARSGNEIGAWFAAGFWIGLRLQGMTPADAVAVLVEF